MGYISKSAIAELYVSPFLVLKGISEPFSRVAIPFYISTRNV